MKAVSIGNLWLVLALGAGGSEVAAQCPAVSEVSPTIIGRTIHPATSYWSLTGDVADGDYVVIDTTGVNMAFEFDNNNSVGAGRIQVPIPANPPNRDAARSALRDAINAQPTCPCTASCIYSPQFPEYFTLVWKGEAGYGATNSNPVDANNKISVNPFFHEGAAASHILLTGTSLNAATSVRLERGADVLNGTWEYTPADGLKRGFKVSVVPNGANPSAYLPSLGDYDIVLTQAGCPDLRMPTAVKVVDNLLDDSTFSMHFLGNTNENGCGGYGSYNVWPGPLWKHNGVEGQPVESFDYREKADTYSLGCRRTDPYIMDDWIWGSLTSDRLGMHEVWQEIPVNFTTPTMVTLTGMYSGGTAALMNYGAKLLDQSGTLIAQDANSDSDWINATPPNANWANFALTGTFPGGTTKIKAVFYLEILSDYWGATVHLDDLLLFEGQVCAEPPAITSVSPSYGVRGDTDATITVDGSNFVSGNTTVRLFREGVELGPTSMSVLSATRLTATFNLTDADRDYWSVIVENPGCPVGTLTDCFNVVLAGPALSNGSFELPAAASNGCAADTSVAGAIEDWTSIHITPYGGGSHVRDVLDSTKFMPTCPPPDGDHWASVQAPDNSYGGMRRLTQTVTVTANQTYTLSGWFAGGGPNSLGISLLDGGHAGRVIASKGILPGPGSYDWTFGYVAGKPTRDLLTAVWDTTNTDLGKKIGHADALVLQECTAAVDVTAIAPTLMGSGGDPVTGAVVTGSGFSGGTPEVYLVDEGRTYWGSNVQVSGDTSLTCSFDLAIASPMAAYDLIVGNHGCFKTLADAVTIIPSVLFNGDFEEPFAELHCNLPAGPPTPVTTPVYGWSYEGELIRDGDVHYPTCPSLPFTPGGHYGSMSTGDGEVRRAWQTLKTNPYGQYTFGGWFAGGGTANVRIKLVDGMTPDGPVIASADVSTGGETYDWREHSVMGYALSELTTVVWEMTDATGPCATHADGLTVTAGLQCNPAFADVEPDGDMDQADFAFFQRCITTGNPAGGLNDLPAYCRCLDKRGPGGSPDGQVNEMDLSAFIECAQGPGVPVVCP